MLESPSSKALHKHHNNSSTTIKAPRRQSSVSPDRAQPPSATTGISHRRAVSDLRLTQGSSSTNLTKNVSHSSLKRNRSHADVVKRNKSATQLQPSNSSSGLNKLKPAKTQVHFDLGTDADDQEEEDEWVDASTSASPYISRRGSVVSSGQSSEKQTASNNNSRPHTPREPPIDEQSTTAPSPPSAQQQDRERDRATANHNQYLTSRLLKRTASYGAPPKMSPNTAQAGSRSDSPDGMQDSASTLAGTPRLTSEVRAGSSGAQAMTSRFVTADNASGSRIATAGSFYNLVPGGGAPVPKSAAVDESNSQIRRPKSMGALAQQNTQGMSAGVNFRHEESTLTDDDEAGGITTTGRRRRKGYVVPPAELSRTQQKLNLERASSTLEPNHSHHQGPVAGALLGGAGYDSRDPRIGRLLERTGMEYLVVRRYQNPVARSLARLAQHPGQDKNRRIPSSNGTPQSRNGHTKRTSEYGGGRFALGGSFRENDTRDIHSSGSQAARRPATPRRAVSALTANGAGSSLDTDDGVAGLQDRLSGVSLVNGEDDGTLALLRNMWEKNPDPSASQD